MLRSSELVCLVAALISFAATTSGEAKVLRNKSNASAVLIFKDANSVKWLRRLFTTTPS